MVKISAAEGGKLSTITLEKQEHARAPASEEDPGAVKVLIPKRHVVDSDKTARVEDPFEQGAGASLVHMLKEQLQEDPNKALEAAGSLSAERVRDLLK